MDMDVCAHNMNMGMCARNHVVTATAQPTPELALTRCNVDGKPCILEGWLLHGTCKIAHVVVQAMIQCTQHDKQWHILSPIPRKSVAATQVRGCREGAYRPGCPEMATNHMCFVLLLLLL